MFSVHMRYSAAMPKTSIYFTESELAWLRQEAEGQEAEGQSVSGYIRKVIFNDMLKLEKNAQAEINENAQAEVDLHAMLKLEKQVQNLERRMGLIEDLANR